MRILFAGNQGGMPVIELNCSIANALAGVSPDAQIDFVVWRRSEQDAVRAAVPGVGHVYCYEEFLASDRSDWPSHLERVATDYPEVNWSGVIASERSFTDYSFLLSGAGHRTESYDYVQRLLVNTVRFFESVFAGSAYDAVVCQTADSFFTHVLFKVAQHFGAKMFAISPAWLQEDAKPGCFFTNDEYMRCDRMIAAYRKLLSQTLTPEQTERADRFRQAVIGFDGNKAFYSVNKRSFGRNPLSPNIRRLPSYIFQNLRKDKNLDYIRIDPVAKVRANVMRLWRFWRCRFLVGGANTPVPHKAVFFALHFQPEQSNSCRWHLLRKSSCSGGKHREIAAAWLHLGFEGTSRRARSASGLAIPASCVVPEYRVLRRAFEGDRAPSRGCRDHHRHDRD